MTKRAKLSFFGTASLVDEEGSDVPLPRMGFALALFLILERRTLDAARVDAASFLWPNSRTALTNLRQLLVRLRTAQGGIALFSATEDRVRLHLDEVDCDLVEVRSMSNPLALGSAERCMAVVSGGLLGSALSFNGELGTWLRAQATTIQTTVVAAVSDVLEHRDAWASPATSLAVSARLLEIDPYAEAAWRGLIRGYCGTGQPTRASRAFADYRRTMTEDLSLAPSKSVEELFLRLTGAAATTPTVAATAVSRMPPTKPGPSTAIPRLVILAPDGSLGAPDGLETIAKLLVEDVTIGLCSVRSIDVVASHTAWQLSDDLLDDEAVERFRIGYVLKTSLIEFAGKKALVAKLHETSGRSIIWADRIELSEAASEGCYRRMSIATISALADAIDHAEQVRYEGRESPTAYYWHLVGQRNLREYDLPGVRRARKSFSKALKADPGFAPAHSGHARSLQREWLLLGRGDHDLLDAAQASGHAATRSDPRDARGFRELGISNLYLRRFEESLASYEQAERLSPRHADIIADHADALAHSGKPEEGLAKMLRAFELNPMPPEEYHWALGGIQFQLFRYEDAIQTISRMRTPDARLRLLAASWAMLGDIAKANEYATEFLETYPSFRIEKWLPFVPNRDPRDTEHYERGLRAAGFL